MTDEETLTEIGRLVREAREGVGQNRKTAAERMGLNESTVGNLERGLSSAPTRSTKALIETYYGWRHGAIDEIWENRRSLRLDELSLESMLPAPATGLAKASELTDQELMAELNFRFLMRDTRDR